MKNAVFGDVARCRSCVNRRFGVTYCLHLQSRKIRERGNQLEQVAEPIQAGSSLTDLFTLKMEALRSSETSDHTRSTRRHIPEDGILHSHRCENLKYYNDNVSFRVMLYLGVSMSIQDLLTVKHLVLHYT
jgi:hypothetical protein